MDRIARFLVLDVFHQHDPLGAFISGVDNNGHIYAQGSFGISPEVIQALNDLGVWDKVPAVDVIRNGTPLYIRDDKAIMAQYPSLTAHSDLMHPTIAWPLNLGEERLGAIQMQFAQIPAEEQISNVLSGLTPIIALYMSMSDVNGDSSNGHRSEVASSNGSGQPPLTNRQMTILQMMARGLTNPQIAARIGFSDSTVRQETMAIYRFLGAHGRRDASRIARVRGLIRSDLPDINQLSIHS